MTASLPESTLDGVVPDGLRSSPTVRQLIDAGRTSWSFELFPPKSAEEEHVLWTAIRRLEALNPTFVSVTYGAGGSTSRATIAVTERIATETSLTPLAHLTAVGHSVTELRRLVGSYAGVGVRNVLALRGDPPGDPQAEWVRHPEGLSYASELVSLVRDLGDFCVGVAAFPDGHPRAASLEHDADVLAAKADAGAEFALTQMFFTPDSYARLLDRLDRRGVRMPVIPEVMPITSVGQIERFALLAGVPFPSALADRLQSAPDRAAVRAIGIEVAIALVQDLLTLGAPGVHFITLNRSTAATEVYRAVTGA